MSFDLHVWCSKEVDLAPAFVDEPHWTGKDELWTYDSASAFINVELQEVDEEELEEMVPELVANYPGFRWLVDINFSARRDEPADLDLLVRVAQKIASVTAGVVEDPQAETFTILGSESDGAQIEETHMKFMSFATFVKEQSGP